MNTQTVQTDRRPTAATFQAPLLKVLHRLTGGQANRLVQMDQAITATCLESGIGENDHGTQASSGKPQVQVWIQVAWHDLKTLGQGVSDAPRGRWGLTPAGIAAAAALNSQPAAPVAAEPPKATPPVVRKDAIDIAQFQTPPSKVDAFDTDPHIMALAIARTPCFKDYSARSPVCAGCSLQGPCRTAQGVELATLAAQWRVLATSARLVPVQAKEEAPKPVKHDNTGSERIICAVESICCRCNQTMAKDSECWYIQRPNGESVLFHLTCA